MNLELLLVHSLALWWDGSRNKCSLVDPKGTGPIRTGRVAAGGAAISICVDRNRLEVLIPKTYISLKG